MTINAYDALRHAFFSVFRNMGQAIQFAWPWLVVLLVVGLGLYWIVLQSGFGQTPLDTTAGAGTFTIAVIIGATVYVTALSSIAVNWHRYVLLDDMSPGGNRLRVDGHVWRYMLRAVLAALLTGLIIAIPLFVVGMALAFAFGDFNTETGEGSFWTRLLFQTIAATILLAVFFRSALALPAAAIGRFDIGIGKSWEATKGNFGSFVGIAFGSTILQVGVDLAMNALGNAAAFLGSAAATSIIIGLSVVFTWFFTFFGITLLTSLYGFFIEKRAL
jgi:hypothetical protein